jgi:hypothetical protein
MTENFFDRAQPSLPRAFKASPCEPPSHFHAIAPLPRTMTQSFCAAGQSFRAGRKSFRTGKSFSRAAQSGHRAATFSFRTVPRSFRARQAFPRVALLFFRAKTSRHRAVKVSHRAKTWFELTEKLFLRAHFSFLRPKKSFFPAAKFPCRATKSLFLNDLCGKMLFSSLCLRVSAVNPTFPSQK